MTLLSSDMDAAERRELNRPCSPVISLKYPRTLEPVQYSENDFQGLVRELRDALEPSPPAIRANSPDYHLFMDEDAPDIAADTHQWDDVPYREPDSADVVMVLIGVTGPPAFRSFIEATIGLPSKVSATTLLNHIIAPENQSPLTVAGRYIGKMKTAGLFVGKSGHIWDITKPGWTSPSLGFLQLGLFDDIVSGRAAQLPYHMLTPALESDERQRLLELYLLPEDTRLYSLYLYREVREIIQPVWYWLISLIGGH